MAGNRGEGIILQPRDRKLLATLRVMRMIDREQARALAPFGSVARANARLLQLTQAGYLKRSFHGTINGGRKAVYRLPGSRSGHGRQPWRADKIEHELGLADLYVAFRSPPATEWRRLDAPLSPGIGIIPDALVQVRFRGESLPMFIEFDRGTEGLRIIESKARSYVALAASGEFARLTKHPRFRVLFVTTSARRLATCRARIAAVTEKLFWFATISSIKQSGPWSPVWMRPSGDERVPLLQPPCDTADHAADSQPAGLASARSADDPMA